MIKKYLTVLIMLLFAGELEAQHVGIGTTTPNHKLELKNGNFLFSNTGSDNPPEVAAPISSDGTVLYWYANKSAFRTGTFYASHLLNDSIGVGSSAMGLYAVAKGDNAFAHGYFSRANQYGSVSIGNETSAMSAFEIVLGTRNATYTPLNPGSWNAKDRLLTIGNGSASNTRSNALVMLKNGSTGFGTSQPLARLHVADSSVLFSADGEVPASQFNSPVSGAGRRMMWYADKAAFRAGYVSGDQWDKTKTGNYSAVTGYNSVASQFASVAFGNESLSEGFASATIGDHLIARSAATVVVGSYNNPIEPISGLPNNFSQEDPVFIVGKGSFLGRSNGMVLLRNGNTGIGVDAPSTRLDVNGQVRIRGGAPATGKLLSCASDGTATWVNPAKLTLEQPGSTGLASIEWRSNGSYRGGFGYDASAGRFFFFDGESNTNTFYINNGRFGIQRDATTNALEVGGDASKSTAGSWLGNSDARLKKNLLPVTNALDKLLQLKGITYEWNDDKTGYKRPAGLQYGFTAQNVQQVFPELVSTDAQGYLQTAYGTYDPLLIEALRELKAANDLLRAEIEKIKATNCK